MSNNKILVVIDGSYFTYYSIFSAVNKYSKQHAIEWKSMIKPPEETDQENLPNLLTSQTFVNYLKKAVMQRCEVVDWLLKKHHQEDLDLADKIDIVFAADDYLGHSFRKIKHPEYKAQRKLVKKSYDVGKILDYVLNNLFDELDLDGNFGYNIVRVKGAEGDDVIASTIKNFNDYNLKIIIAADKDFLQLDNVKQYNLMGDEVVRRLHNKKYEGVEIDPKTFLLMKILMGDGADNIPAVAKGIGEVKAWKLANDKETLKSLLKESQAVAEQFSQNRFLIDFNRIPKELENAVVDKVTEALAKDELKHNKEDLLLDSIQNVMEL